MHPTKPYDQARKLTTKNRVSIAEIRNIMLLHVPQKKVILKRAKVLHASFGQKWQLAEFFSRGDTIL